MYMQTQNRYENAPPEPPQIYCPLCKQPLGWQDEVFLMGGGDTVAGCSRCLHSHNAQEWYEAELDLAAQAGLARRR